MTVKELIAFLKKQPQGIEVTYQACSENCKLQASNIRVEELGPERDDGWVENKRPDKPSKAYLRFPGN